MDKKRPSRKKKKRQSMKKSEWLYVIVNNIDSLEAIRKAGGSVLPAWMAEPFFSPDPEGFSLCAKVKGSKVSSFLLELPDKIRVPVIMFVEKRKLPVAIGAIN